MGLRHQFLLRYKARLRLRLKTESELMLNIRPRIFALVCAAVVLVGAAFSIPGRTGAAPSEKPTTVAATLSVSSMNSENDFALSSATMAPTALTLDGGIQPVPDPGGELVAAAEPTSPVVTVGGGQQKATAVSIIRAVQATPKLASTELQDDPQVGFQMLYLGRVKTSGAEYLVQVMRPGVNASHRPLLVAGEEQPNGSDLGARVFDVAGQATAAVRGKLIVSIAGNGTLSERLRVLRELDLIA